MSVPRVNTKSESLLVKKKVGSLDRMTFRRDA